MKKALIIRLSSLGDVIFNIPLANVLKQNGYEVSFITSEKGLDVIKDNPAIDKTFLIPTKKWKQNRFSIKNAFEYLSILRKVRAEHFDIAVDTHMMFKSFIWLKFCGAKRRICYEYGKEFSNYGGNEKLNVTPQEKYSLHAVYEHLLYAKHLGLKNADEVKFTLPSSTAETKTKIDNLLKNIDKSKPLVIICPATTWRLKHWNKENWKILVNEIQDKCTLVFSGTAGDTDLISYISQDKYLSLAGKTNIKDLIELFSRADIVIAPDSGSSHLARATNIPAVISIFTCTPPYRYGPFGNDKKYFAIDGKLKCQPCHTRKCPLEGKDAEQCVNNPKPQEIINIVNNLLQNIKHSV